jgi:hypothetical protein
MAQDRLDRCHARAKYGWLKGSGPADVGKVDRANPSADLLQDGERVVPKG